MNVDMSVAMTPRNARRLLLLSRTFTMDLPEEIKDLALQDMLTEEEIRDRIPGELFKIVPYEDMAAYCQHAVDFEGRFVAVARDSIQTLTASLGYAFLTDSQLVANASKAFLGLAPIKSLIEQNRLSTNVADAKNPHIGEQDKLNLVYSYDILDLSKTRDRICVVNSDGTFLGSAIIQELVFNCQRVIAVTPQATSSGNRYSSILSSNINNYLEVMYPGLKIPQMLSTSRPDQMKAQGMRTAHTPTIYRSLGVYYGLNPLT